MSRCAVWVIGALLLSVWSAPGMASEERDGIKPRSFAVRVGWAYGLGGELEYRPGAWGVGASGGYVPKFGAGAYVGIQWGARPLGVSGAVAEGGLFRGVRNPLRTAETGLGLYALGGYAFAPTPGTSIRLVAGGGLPFSDNPTFPSFEFLAKATAGVAF